MVERSLARVENLVLERPRTVLAAALVVVMAAGWLGLSLELRTSRRELVPEGDVNQARWDAVRAEFTDPEPLIVAVERTRADVPTVAIERTAERIATRLADHPTVSGVFYRVDIDWISEHALHLANPADLRRAVLELDSSLADADGVVRLRNFTDLNNALAARIETSLGEGTVLPSGTETTEAARLREFLEAERDFFASPQEWVAQLPSSPVGLLGAGSRGAVSPNGFLASTDGDLVFVLVHPAGDASGGLERFQALVAATREAVDAAIEQEAGIRVGLTGPPAMEVEEMASVGRDGRRTSLIAISGVFLLSLLAFHRRFHAVIGLATLAVGVISAIGAVMLEFGYLNLITTSLIPILVGMGIDYAVHPISQYEIERRTLSRLDAVRATFRKTGRPVVVSAVTTSVAFFCFVAMQFRGFSELGIVTGFGVLLCLGAAVFVLPALLAVAGRGHREHRDAAVDKIWDEGAAGLVCAAPRATVLVAALVTVAAVPALWQLKVNPSLLEMMPIGAESLHYLEVMNERSALRNDFNLVLVDTLDGLESIRDRAATQPTIERFESLLTFLPDDAAASTAAVAEAAELLDRVVIEGASSTVASLTTSMDRLQEALAEAADAAFLTGLGELAGELEESRSIVEAMAGQVARSGPVEQAGWADGERVLQAKAATLLDRVKSSAAAPAPTAASLPPELSSRFLTRDGRYVGYLYPVESMYEEDFLPLFNAASLEVSPTAIGFPMLFEDHSNLITAGFGTALGLGALFVAMILLVDLRSGADTVLALVPVALGLIWLIGLTMVLDIDLNFANLIAIPIVLGVGIDAGVHVVHRYRLERDNGMVVALAHTGRAILVASLTTMVGFGSLVMASHRGMASLGLLLFLGVGSCLVAALVVLPNLLLAFGLARR